MIRRPLLGVFLWYLAGMLLMYYKQPIELLKFLTIVLSVSILLFFLISSYNQLYFKHSSNSYNNSSNIDKDNLRKQDNNRLIFCNLAFPWQLIMKQFQIYCFLCLWPAALFFGYVRMERSAEQGVVDHMFQDLDSVMGEVDGTISTITKKSWGEQIVLKNVSFCSEQMENVQEKAKEEIKQKAEGNVRSYHLEKIMVQSSESSTLMVGNRILIKGELKQFQRASNPGQFDEFSYYKNQGFDYKLIPEDIGLISDERNKFHEILAKVKDRISLVYEYILEPKEAGTMIAMLLGDKYLLDGDISELYQKNGLTHILAISGLHISLIGLSLHRLLRIMGISIYIATPISIAIVVSYGVMTGMSVSTERAILMFILLLLAPIVSRTYDGISSLSFTGLILLIINPLDLFQAGFLLSFGAVVGITILYPVFKNLCPWKHPILDGLMVSFSAQLMTTPIILWYFYQIPVYSVLINLIILPTSTILMLSALIAGILGCFSVPLGIFSIGGTNYILKFYEMVCRVGATLPGAVYTVGRPKLWVVVMYYLLLALFLLQISRAQKLDQLKESKLLKEQKLLKDRRLMKSHLLHSKLIQYPILLHLYRLYTATKYLLLLILALGFLCYPQKPESLELTMIDVGQGDGILIRKDDVTFFVDGGSSNIKSVGSKRIKPLLFYKGIAKVDYWFLTHMDEDHINGMMEVMALGDIHIPNVVLPKLWLEDSNGEKESSIVKEILELAEFVRGHGGTVLFMERGDEIKTGNLTIKALHPYKEYEARSSNDMSLVLGIQYGEFDCLLTGDVEGKGELELITELRDYDVLKVAHHGSKYSSSAMFLEVAKPEYALISCSKKNSYGHPHEELLQRLESIDSNVYITAKTGAIEMLTDGQKLKVWGYLD